MYQNFWTIFLIIEIKLIGTAWCGCPETVYSDVKGFQTGCKFRCNCKDNEQCDLETGECPSGCLRGWMGPACQYRNHAFVPHYVSQYKNQNDKSHYALKAIDGDTNTCSKTGGLGLSSGQQWWYVDFSYHLYIVGFIIKIPNEAKEKFRGFTIEIGNDTNSKRVCYKHGSNTDGNESMTIYCEEPFVGKVVEIKLPEDVDELELCEVEIFGGRLLSFNKPTWASDILEYKGYWNSSYAVDGRQMLPGEIQNTESIRTCMATKKYVNQKILHKWNLDLETEYFIQGISFFGRFNYLEQFRSFKIFVHGYNTTSRAPVFTDDLVEPYFPKSVNLSRPVLGSKVQIQRNADILVICEVEVFGECPVGKCGWDCEKVCMCKGQTTGTAKMQGWCPYGCLGRWSGQNGSCNIECSNSKWGPTCENLCGKCKNNDACSVSDGTCPNSCQTGWIPPLCKQECINNTYGEDCNSTCGHCEHGQACNTRNGECTNGCSPGYIPPLCSQACEPYFYGDNCNQTCGKCRNGTVCNFMTGVCPDGCEAGYKGQTCTSQQRQQEKQSSQSSAIGSIVGAVVAVLIILIIFLACLIYKKKLKRAANKPENRTQSTLQNQQNQSVGVNYENILTKYSQDVLSPKNIEMETNKGGAIKISELREYSKKAKVDFGKLRDDFRELPFGLKYDASEARSVEYRSKNRYKDLYPYNVNRVVLPEISGDITSTYINASYIDGYSCSKKYIAAQGAIQTTVDDIWRMVWSQQVSVIIMLTNTVELGMVKCLQYWPDDGSMKYGDIQVELISVEEYADFKIRTFHSFQIESGEKRTVRQYHYTAWPDKAVPDSALSLVQFWRKTRRHSKANKYPWMVHCSAGIGRTGTFIALDYLYDQGKSEKIVDVKEGVNTLRKQRLNMVQTIDQYVYLHEAVAEALVPIGTVCGKDEFVNTFSKLSPQEKTHILQAEFNRITEDTKEGPSGPSAATDNIYINTSETVDQQGYSSAFLEENIPKSRDLSIVPKNLDRPMLSMSVKGRNDFINAVFVPTYREKDRMIVTQFPLKDTVVDFVRMIWGLNIKTVVLLEETAPEDGLYWSTNEVPRVIPPFEAKLLSENKLEFYTLRNVRYSFLQDDSEEQKDVKMFHFQAWPSADKIPRNSAEIIQLISDIADNSEDSGPLVIQCLNGAAKSGLLCAVISVLERMKTDGDIAIAETIRMIRLRRNQIIGNFEQYQSCHDIVRSYIETDDVYANVM